MSLADQIANAANLRVCILGLETQIGTLKELNAKQSEIISLLESQLRAATHTLSIQSLQIQELQTLTTH